VREDWRYALAGTAGRAAVDALLATVRYELDEPPAYRALLESGQPILYVLWHGRLLPLTHANRGRGLVTLISLSRDGEYIARIVEGWDYTVVRGSTSRGGAKALARLVRLARQGRSIAVTPDGPRGPRERMKPGALLLARRAGLPVVPAAAAATRAWWFEGWDRFLVPQPFSRVRIAYGEPMSIEGEDEATLEQASREVEARLAALQAQVDRAVA